MSEAPAMVDEHVPYSLGAPLVPTTNPLPSAASRPVISASLHPRHLPRRSHARGRHRSPRPHPRPSQLLHACRPPTHTHLPPPPHHNRLRNGRSSGRTARTLVPSLARRAMHSRRKGAHSPPHLPRRTPREAEAAPDLLGPPTRTRTRTLVSNFGRPLFARAGEGSSSLSGERVCQRLSRRGGWVAALCPQRIFACPEVGSARLEAIGRR